MDMELNKSWLHGKYEKGYEINTNLPYIAFGDDFFAQGDDADKIISEVLEIYLNEELTEPEAMDKWASMYL